VIPREGVERQTYQGVGICCVANFVIPREGVERIDLIIVRFCCANKVIPREGVESSHYVAVPVKKLEVIPREGVESFAELHRWVRRKLMQGSDPERGS